MFLCFIWIMVPENPGMPFDRRVKEVQKQQKTKAEGKMKAAVRLK